MTTISESKLACFNHLIQDVFVEVRHVTLTGDRAVIIVPKVLLQSNWVMWDTQDCAEVVGQHLNIYNVEENTVEYR